MRYCSKCGREVDRKVPAGDTLPRFVCESCGTIHYQNPKMVVGTLPVFEDRILLARRAIAPRHGLWTLPAGFMENNETTGEAALRETREEVCAEVELGMLFSLVNIAHISQVHLFYLARMSSPHFAPGAESLEARLFAEDEIPWDEIAFRSSTLTLRHFLDDRRRQAFSVHLEDLAGNSRH
ncbi:MAG: NUDIX hydrolase [Rhodocyclaceae bacterium]|nr:NUDIX hydrolase [Rhodocyclaceae bacterium]